MEYVEDDHWGGKYTQTREYGTWNSSNIQPLRSHNVQYWRAASSTSSGTIFAVALSAVPAALVSINMLGGLRLHVDAPALNYGVKWTYKVKYCPLQTLHCTLYFDTRVWQHHVTTYFYFGCRGRWSSPLPPDFSSID